MSKDSVWHKHIFANTKTKTIFLIILSVIMIGLAILVWANQTGKISLWAAGTPICGSNYGNVKIFHDTNCTGVEWVLGIEPGCKNAPAVTNDKASAVGLANGWSVILYKDANCQGESYTPTASGNLPANFNDVVSSAKLSTTTQQGCVVNGVTYAVGSKWCTGTTGNECLANGIVKSTNCSCESGSIPTCSNGICGCTAAAVCTPGQKKCEGDKPAVCASNGTWSVARTGCSLSGQTCVNGECVGSPTPPTTTTPAPPSGECTTGEAKCTTNILRTFCYASPVGNIWQSEYCGTGQTCTNGTCSGTVTSSEVNPKVTGNCEGPITITWNPIAKATHFIVRSQDENGTWAQYDAIRDGSTSFTIKGFTGKITKVEVAAWSNFTGGKLAEGTADVPCGKPEPQNLEITTTGDCNGPVAASWNAIANATHYTFEWQTADDAWALYGNPITGTSHTINNNEWDSSLPIEKRQVVTVRATAYNEATGQQLAQGTANISCDDPVKEFCDAKCKTLGYASGACTFNAQDIENGELVGPCEKNGLNISGIDECITLCQGEEDIAAPCGSYTCCCSKKAEPEPTPSPTETNYINQLVSTGASLWVNIFFALLLVTGVGLYIFRDEIYNRSKK